jgi:hypothetical protein
MSLERERRDRILDFSENAFKLLAQFEPKRMTAMTALVDLGLTADEIEQALQPSWNSQLTWRLVSLAIFYLEDQKLKKENMNSRQNLDELPFMR